MTIDAQETRTRRIGDVSMARVDNTVISRLPIVIIWIGICQTAYLPVIVEAKQPRRVGMRAVAVEA